MLQEGMPPINGRDAIRRFLASFDGHAQVDTALATSDEVDVHGRVATQWGTFYQVARIDGDEPGRFRGRYVARWVRGKDGRWLLSRIAMQPAKGE